MINKVIDRNNNVLIDLTNDTVSPNKVLAGTKFHGADGKEYIGEVQPNELDSLKYNFIDYDGTLMYSFTDEEIDAMTELPAGPDHTDDNLTFQEWNWTLDELKAVDRTRLSRPIVGANLITTDEKSYFTIHTNIDNTTETFMLSSPNSSTTIVVDIDWGDGSTETANIKYNTQVSHTFVTGNTDYTVVIGISPNSEVKDGLRFGNTSGDQSGTALSGARTTNIKLGRIVGIGGGNKLRYSKIKKINIPNTLIAESYKPFSEVPFLEALVFPRGFLSKAYTLCTQSFSLKTISLSPTMSSIPSQTFSDVYSLTNIYIHDGISTLESSVFYSCTSLRFVDLPNSITSLGSSCFSQCESIEQIILPPNITQVTGLEYCYSLRSLVIPNNVTKISAMGSCKSLKEIVIPDSVTTISTNTFQSCGFLTLDLSQQTKVIPLTGNIGFSTNYGNLIKVPAALLDQYKSASYWSNLASIMVGV